MEKVLQLVFKKSDGKEKIVSVKNPRADVSAADGAAAMQAIITADIFNTDGVSLTEAVEARMRTTDTTVLA